MARPIRNIPTLFGNEAQSFIREAERVEANPGTIKVQRKRVIGRVERGSFTLTLSQNRA